MKWFRQFVENGEVFPCLLAASVLHDSAGNSVGVMGVSRDITKRKCAEEKAQANSVKSLFLANMSHEILTPLNAIIGFTDLIKQSTQHLLNPEERTFFETIDRSGKRLMRTVHGILDISQLEAGIINLEANTALTDQTHSTGST